MFEYTGSEISSFKDPNRVFSDETVLSILTELYSLTNEQDIKKTIPNNAYEKLKPLYNELVVEKTPISEEKAKEVTREFKHYSSTILKVNSNGNYKSSIELVIKKKKTLIELSRPYTNKIAINKEIPVTTIPLQQPNTYNPTPTPDSNNTPNPIKLPDSLNVADTANNPIEPPNVADSANPSDDLNALKPTKKEEEDNIVIATPPLETTITTTERKEQDSEQSTKQPKGIKDVLAFLYKKDKLNELESTLISDKEEGKGEEEEEDENENEDDLPLNSTTMILEHKKRKRKNKKEKVPRRKQNELKDFKDERKSNPDKFCIRDSCYNYKIEGRNICQRCASINNEAQRTYYYK